MKEDIVALLVPNLTGIPKVKNICGYQLNAQNHAKKLMILNKVIRFIVIGLGMVTSIPRS